MSLKLIKVNNRITLEFKDYADIINNASISSKGVINTLNDNYPYFVLTSNTALPQTFVDENGNYYFHSERISTAFIPFDINCEIKPITFTSPTKIFSFRVCEYNEQYVFLGTTSYYVSYGAVFKTENQQTKYIILNFLFLDTNNNKLDHRDTSLVNESVYIINTRLKGFLKDQVIEELTPLSVVSNTTDKNIFLKNFEWRQGVRVGNIDSFDNGSTKITTYNKFHLKYGHQYRIMFSYNNATKVDNFGVSYFDKNGLYIDNTFSWYGNNPETTSFAILNKNPVDREVYVDFQILNYNGITPADVENINPIVIDETASSIIPSYTPIIEFQKSGTYCQGMTSYSHYVFLGWSNSKITIFNMLTKEIVADNISVPNNLHMNSIQFGPKYESTDDFGVLYCGSETIGGKIYGLRFVKDDSTYTISTVYELDMPIYGLSNEDDEEKYFGWNTYFDFRNNIIVLHGYVKDLNKTGNAQYGDSIIKVFRTSSWTTNPTYTELGSMRIGKLWAVLGGTIYDNKLYMVAGNTRSGIFVFDIYKLKILDFYSLFRFTNDEIQSLTMCDGKCLVSSTRWVTYAVDSYYTLASITY